MRVILGTWQYEQYNPLREPNWRKQRVDELMREGNEPSTRLDDEPTTHYYRFLKRYMKADTEGKQQILHSKFPDEYWATLWAASPIDDRRVLLEALLLARCSDHEIGARLGLKPSTVDCYEKIFYNVRDRIDQTLYINSLIIKNLENRRPSDTKGDAGCLSPSQYETAYKLCAYHGGPLVLDAVYTGFSATPAPLQVGSVKDWFRASIESQLQGAGLIATNSLRLNKYNILDIIERNVDLLKSKSDEQTNIEFVRNIQSFVGQIRWSIGDAQPQTLTSDHMEPRVAEKLEFTQTGQAPESLDMWKDVSFKSISNHQDDEPNGGTKQAK